MLCLGDMSSVKRSNSVPNEEDILKNEDSCLQNKANLKGDWLNVFLLVLLYTTEYIPHGFIISLPIIFQSKKLVTYEEQVNIDQNSNTQCVTFLK